MNARSRRYVCAAGWVLLGIGAMLALCQAITDHKPTASPKSFELAPGDSLSIETPDGRLTITLKR